MTKWDRQKLIMLVGIPASGKSTYGQILKRALGCDLHDVDEIRIDLFNDVNDHSHNTQVYEELNRRIQSSLGNGKSVIVDACNTKRKRRMSILSSIPKSVYKQCVICDTSLTQALKNNQARERRLDPSVITGIFNGLERPIPSEGFDSIVVHKFIEEQ